LRVRTSVVSFAPSPIASSRKPPVSLSDRRRAHQRRRNVPAAALPVVPSGQADHIRYSFEMARAGTPAKA
jgi:hypothetical protein